MTDMKKNSGEVFRELLEAAPDAMVIVDERGEIVFVNTQAETLFGYSRSELMGQSVELLVPSRLRRQHGEHRQRYAEEPHVRAMGTDLELSACTKEGREFPVEISLSPLVTEQGPVVSAAIRDITSRVRTERELREARREAEQANMAKTRFLAAASHDLRQPLQAAIMYNNVLRRQTGSTPQAETVAKLQNSLEALRDLLNRLLDISRLEAGAITPEKMSLSLRILFERLADEFLPQAEEKGLELRFHGTSLRVRSDPQLLEQLLRNLVSNAVRYTEEGRVLVGCRRAGPDIRIQVWDTGIGIPDDQTEAIFEAFYQVENPSRLRHAGLGLGLAIVKRLSALLEHPVEVRSELGRGTLFEVCVPLARSRAARRRGGSRRRASAAAKGRVVVIDDDPDVLDALRLSLEMAGHEVVAASSPDEVLASPGLGDAMPDVIVSDYRLPEGMAGAAAIGMLREALERDIPGILLTGDSSSAQIREAKKSGFPLLHKPADAEELEEQIRRALAGGIRRRRQARRRPTRRRTATPSIPDDH